MAGGVALAPSQNETNRAPIVRLRPIRRPYSLLYGPLEGRTAYYTVRSTDRKLLGGKWWKAAVELGGLT